MNTPELAKIAYETYAEHTSWKNFWGSVPSWAMLPEKIREAWIASVQAVLVAIEDEAPIDIQIGDEP